MGLLKPNPIMQEIAKKGEEEKAAEAIPSPIPTSKTNIVISIYNDEYDEDKPLTAIKDDAEKFQSLLKEKFRYEVPSVAFLKNIKTGEKLMEVFEKLLERVQRDQPKGETLGRFILYRVFFFTYLASGLEFSIPNSKIIIDKSEFRNKNSEI